MIIQSFESMTILKDSIEDVLESFLSERISKGLSKNTILFYKREISYFRNWLAGQGIYHIQDITPTLIREHLTELSNRRNKGGIHANYRAIKAYLLFYENEFEPINWKNPISKIRVQKNHINPLRGIALENVHKLVSVCNGRFTNRDKAIFLCLVSSGCRASEFLNLNIEDVDLVSGKVKVIGGKGDKNRTTFISREARKALRRYLFSRKTDSFDNPDNNAVWLNYSGQRLTKSGLEHLFVKYSKLAGITKPGAHDFRRCFALTCYREGVEILIISQLLGHSSVEITKRYLNIDTDDLKRDYDKVEF